MEPDQSQVQTTPSPVKPVVVALEALDLLLVMVRPETPGAFGAVAVEAVALLLTASVTLAQAAPEQLES